VFAPAVLLIAMAMLPAVAEAQTGGAPLVLETKIPLGEVSGRIDHLAIDAKRQRLFVAELGNNSLGVVDLAAGKVLHRIAGFNEPQGVAYVPFADSIYVANAGDGSVRVLRGVDLAPIGRVDLGDDADNVRIDTRHNRVLVGYGKGALAVVDPASHAGYRNVYRYQLGARGWRALGGVMQVEKPALLRLIAEDHIHRAFRRGRWRKCDQYKTDEGAQKAQHEMLRGLSGTPTSPDYKHYTYYDYLLD
jgi:hypothetical protein